MIHPKVLAGFLKVLALYGDEVFTSREQLRMTCINFFGLKYGQDVFEEFERKMKNT